jgi:hypothetical protein
MKRLFKNLARTLWRISAPISRPVIRKFDRHMMWLLGTATLQADAAGNLDLTLNSLLRELARLQMQVETLQQQIDDLHATGGGADCPEGRLSVVGKIR